MVGSCILTARRGDHVSAESIDWNEQDEPATPTVTPIEKTAGERERAEYPIDVGMTVNPTGRTMHNLNQQPRRIE